MSTLETNSIGKYSGNNVSIDDALNLKSYTTAQRDALTSVAGDMIYNSDDGTIDFYNGTAWTSSSPSTFSVPIEYLIIAGGGAGGATGPAANNYGGGGGAGGYRNSYASENSGDSSGTETVVNLTKNTSYTVTIGAGGTGTYTVNGTGRNGTDSSLWNITSDGGGAGGGLQTGGWTAGINGGSGGAASEGNGTVGLGTTNQGGDGGTVAADGCGGGGGASGNGSNGSVNTGGTGGNGLPSSITGSSVTRGGGGGGSGANVWASGGTGGGGAANKNGNATSGTVNTGGGGGGAGQNNSGSYSGGNGGSGVVILRWATNEGTIGATRTGLTDGGVQTDGTDSYIVFTAGTGNITFS